MASADAAPKLSRESCCSKIPSRNRSYRRYWPQPWGDTRATLSPPSFHGFLWKTPLQPCWLLLHIGTKHATDRQLAILSCLKSPRVSKPIQNTSDRRSPQIWEPPQVSESIVPFSRKGWFTTCRRFGAYFLFFALRTDIQTIWETWEGWGCGSMIDGGNSLGWANKLDSYPNSTSSPCLRALKN